jgi:hypothetical protein
VAILTWIASPGPVAVILTLVALLVLVLAVPHFLIRLVTTLDSRHLHLRLPPLGLPIPFLPPRIKDVALSDISRWEVHTYRALKDREYWGRHFWGLGGSASRGGRYLYIMKAGSLAGRGVQLDVGNGERLLIGSEHPEELATAIELAKNQA